MVTDTRRIARFREPRHLYPEGLYELLIGG